MKQVIEIVLINIGICALAVEYYILQGLRRLFTKSNGYTLSDFIEHRVSGRKLLFG